MNNKVNARDKCWYICLSDNDICPEGYAGYIFPDNSFIKNIDFCRKMEYPNITIITDWLRDEDEIIKAEKYIVSVRKMIMHYISNDLNHVHQADYSEDEWYVMLGEWLCYYIPQLLDKYRRINKIKDLGKNCVCSGYIIDRPIPTVDYVDYIYSATHLEKFHKYQYIQLFQETDNSSWLSILLDDTYEHNVYSTQWDRQVLIKGKVYDLFNRFLHFFLRRQDRVVVHGSLLPNNYLTRIVFDNIGYITNYIGIHERETRNNIQLCFDFRTKATDLFEEDEFTKILVACVQRNLPTAYLEDFKEIRKIARKTYKFGYKNVKAVVFSATGLCSDEVFKAYLMDIKHKRHAKLYVMQHGGNYGIDKMEIDNVEAEISDYQYTWGWEMEYDFSCKCIPMPAGLLMGREKASDTFIHDRILFVDYSFPRHCSIFSREAIWYREDLNKEIDYFKRLSKAVADKLFVRLFPDDYGWMVREQLDYEIENIRYDDIRSFDDSIKASDLCVFSSCSTAIIEALYTNKPCIAYRRKGMLESSAEEVWGELEKEGIICNDWESLLMQTEIISNKVYEWWHEEKRQKAVNHFCDIYAYMPDNAENIWKEEFLRLKGAI